jgi:hypothetical protein
MMPPSLSRLRPVAQQCKKRFAPKAIPLMYHRVTQGGAAPRGCAWHLSILPSNAPSYEDMASSCGCRQWCRRGGRERYPDGRWS